MNYRCVTRWGVFLPSHVLNRISGFGFLAGKEVKAAGVGNLGLHDREYVSLRSRSISMKFEQRGLRFSGFRSTFQHLAAIPKKSQCNVVCSEIFSGALTSI